MKLNRTDLSAGLLNRLFEIPVDSLDLEGLRLSSSTLACTLTSVQTADGYKLTGDLKIPYIESCDRCLETLKDIHNSSFEIWLTTNEEILDEANPDVVWFPESMEQVDLKEVLHDTVFLEESQKYLCQPDCKGLCPNCGANLNREVCECDTGLTNNPWNVLKDLSEKASSEH